MKKMMYTQLLLAVIALSVVNAASKHKEDKCTPSRGTILRCYAKNEGPLLPTGSGKFRIVDEYGSEVGFTETLNSPTGLEQKWVTKDGCVEAKFQPGVPVRSTTPITPAVVRAFPTVAPYLGTDAELWIFAADYNKCDSASVLSLNGSGAYKNINYVEIRCVFLVLKDATTGAPYFDRCIGCYWLLGRK